MSLCDEKDNNPIYAFKKNYFAKFIQRLTNLCLKHLYFLMKQNVRNVSEADVLNRLFTTQTAMEELCSK